MNRIVKVPEPSSKYQLVTEVNFRVKVFCNGVSSALFMIQGPIKQLKVNIKGSKQNEVNPSECLDGKVTQGNLNREHTYTG